MNDEKKTNHDDQEFDARESVEKRLHDFANSEAEMTTENNSVNEDMAARLITGDLPSVVELEERYPERMIPSDARVTRVGPSPTGPMHIGGLFVALISERIAHQSGGVYYLRIEDTDKKREVEGADKLIVKSLEHFGLKPDEGERIDGTEDGEYGPYKQSERENIYKAFIKKLISEGKAYPCFCTEEELKEIAEDQKKRGQRPGYYGEYAKWRNAPVEEVEKALTEERPYVIRFRSNGSTGNKIRHADLVLGEREFPENDLDIVLLKTNGLPTYHFAHVVDDHLMDTNTVIRANEWVASVPLHLQLFEAMGWQPPEYGHVYPIMKQEDGARRKLSKRKDPEATVEFYMSEGIPPEAVTEYLLNIANPSFESWRDKNPELPYTDFEFDVKLLGKSSGALLDLAKLTDISKEVISKMSPETIYDNTLDWAKNYNPDFADLMLRNEEYLISILGVERDLQNRRKDVSRWSEIAEFVGFYFDDIYRDKLLPTIAKETVAGEIDIEIVKDIISDFSATYDSWSDKEGWMRNLKEICNKHHFAESVKQYKGDSSAYRGHIGDVAKMLRVLICGRNQSPDLFEVMNVMGKERVLSRLSNIEGLQ